MKTYLEAGDKVQFTSRKGQVEGVVIRRRTWKQKKFRKYGIDSTTIVVEVADFKGDMIWTVPEMLCKPVGRATRKTLQKAIDLKAGIKMHNYRVSEKRQTRNTGKLKEKELLNLQPGDRFLVKYRNSGYQPETFSHYTKSGKIAFKSPYTKSGVRYCWPDAAKKMSG